MDENTQKKLKVLEAIANGGETYRQMFQEYRTAEEHFKHLESLLPQEQRDIFWDYLGSCEDLSRRMLELACLHMMFP